MPLAIAKWKLNTSLEAKLNYRPISLRNIRERAKFKIQEGIVRGFRDFLYGEGIHRDPYSEDRRQERGGRGEHVPSGLFPQAGSPAAEPAVL